MLTKGGKKQFSLRAKCYEFWTILCVDFVIMIHLFQGFFFPTFHICEVKPMCYCRSGCLLQFELWWLVKINILLIQCKNRPFCFAHADLFFNIQINAHVMNDLLQFLRHLKFEKWKMKDCLSFKYLSLTLYTYVLDEIDNVSFIMWTLTLQTPFRSIFLKLALFFSYFKNKRIKLYYLYVHDKITSSVIFSAPSYFIVR